MTIFILGKNLGKNGFVLVIFFYIDIASTVIKWSMTQPNKDWPWLLLRFSEQIF